MRKKLWAIKTQLWLQWHGGHGKIGSSSGAGLPFGSAYYCIVCEARRPKRFQERNYFKKDK